MSLRHAREAYSKFSMRELPKILNARIDRKILVNRKIKLKFHT